MQSPRCSTLLVVAALVVGCWTTVSVARPSATADSGEPDEDSLSADLTPPAVVTVPIRLLNDHDSMFNKELNKRLSSMSDSNLNVLEAGLRAPAEDGEDIAPQDGEMMMGDEPSSSDGDGPHEQSSGFATTELPDDLTQTLMIRESYDSEEIPIEIVSTPNKKLRLKNIQTQIMQFMGWPAQTSSPSPIIKKRPNATVPVVSTDQQRDAITLLYESVHDFPAYPSDAFTEKTQSFYPTCYVPKHTNEEIWNNKESMNLMFNVSLPKAAHGNLVKVNTAKLRLYKQLVSCNTQTSNETDDYLYCQPTLDENTKLSDNNNMSIAVPVILEDKQIRVSIYAYTRSLKRKRVKRKMLDSRMMPYYGEKWTEWNIRGAVRSWRRDSSRNYGISIEVEDDEGNLLPVVRFFKPLNCSGDASTTTPKPIPWFLMEAMQQHSGTKNGEGNANINVSSLRTMQAFNFNLVHRYPMIDVTTVEVPESEAQTALMYQYAKLAFQENLAGKASQSSVSSRSGDEPQNDHRIRHNTRLADPMRMSKEEREFRDRIIVKGIIHRNTDASQPISSD